MSVPFGHIMYQTDVLKGLGRVAVSPLVRKLKGAPDAPSEVTSLVPSVPEPLRAERDLLIVVTACSVDYHPTNGGVCTEIVVEIVAAA